MSHIVTIKTEVRDSQAVTAACRRLGLPEPVQGTATLFEAQATGLLVKLPGWLYPCVCDTATGQVRFDNYGGQWGDQKHLDAFLQGYAVERAKFRSQKAGPQRLRAGPPRRVRQADHLGRRGCRLKTIEITVSPTGETKVETKGFTGGECREASKFVEQALGQRTAEQLTAEFHQGQPTTQDLRQSQLTVSGPWIPPTTALSFAHTGNQRRKP